MIQKAPQKKKWTNPSGECLLTANRWTTSITPWEDAIVQDWMPFLRAWKLPLPVNKQVAVAFSNVCGQAI